MYRSPTLLVSDLEIDLKNIPIPDFGLKIDGNLEDVLFGNCNESLPTCANHLNNALSTIKPAIIKQDKPIWSSYKVPDFDDKNYRDNSNKTENENKLEMKPITNNCLQIANQSPCSFTQAQDLNLPTNENTSEVDLAQIFYYFDQSFTSNQHEYITDKIQVQPISNTKLTGSTVNKVMQQPNLHQQEISKHLFSNTNLLISNVDYCLQQQNLFPQTMPEHITPNCSLYTPTPLPPQPVPPKYNQYNENTNTPFGITGQHNCQIYEDEMAQVFYIEPFEPATSEASNEFNSTPQSAPIADSYLDYLQNPGNLVIKRQISENMKPKPNKRSNKKLELETALRYAGYLNDDLKRKHARFRKELITLKSWAKYNQDPNVRAAYANVYSEQHLLTC